MKHRAPMTNVATVNTYFMGDSMHFLLPLTSAMVSTIQPFGFA